MGQRSKRLLTRYEFVHFEIWTLVVVVVVVFAVGFTLDRIFVFFVAVVVHDRKKKLLTQKSTIIIQVILHLSNSVYLRKHF